MISVVVKMKNRAVCKERSRPEEYATTVPLRFGAASCGCIRLLSKHREHSLRTLPARPWKRLRGAPEDLCARNARCIAHAVYG